uniref:ENTH domain-containing protein n=1 Tax=Steinernema glaseri TaxID=37863 RepID=A0A1I8AMW0_9BILA
MSISTIRRQVKNVAYNFSDAQVKVREATSNDPWGPTTALMSEIADLTHNPMSFTEIMSMLWKRLNDHGKNWRHVYKSLVLLDYLIKCGSEKVAHQCRENIYSIETLKDFQHIEDNRDQGMNVREKAKQMVSLLYDEERLKNERARFQLTRKRFIQNGSGISSDGKVRTVRKSETGAALSSEFEEARPSSAGEEEMQLQIAMALSKEENEKEEEMRKGDAVRLQVFDIFRRIIKLEDEGMDHVRKEDGSGGVGGICRMVEDQTVRLQKEITSGSQETSPKSEIGKRVLWILRAAKHVHRSVQNNLGFRAKVERTKLSERFPKEAQRSAALLALRPKETSLHRRRIRRQTPRRAKCKRRVYPATLAHRTTTDLAQAVRPMDSKAEQHQDRTTLPETATNTGTTARTGGKSEDPKITKIFYESVTCMTG